MCRANKWSQQVGFEQINCIYPRGYIVRRKQMLNRCQLFVSTIRYGSNNWVVTKSGFGIYIYAQISNNRQHQNSDMLRLILNAWWWWIYIFFNFTLPTSLLPDIPLMYTFNTIFLPIIYLFHNTTKCKQLNQNKKMYNAKIFGKIRVSFTPKSVIIGCVLYIFFFLFAACRKPSMASADKFGI